MLVRDVSGSVASTKRLGVVTACLVGLVACGEDKQVPAEETEGPKTSTETQPESPPDKRSSVLAKACEPYADAADKANCLCRVDALQAGLSKELLTKLETAPEAATTDATVEHLGGMANLSKVYEAMRKASEQCAKGAAR